MRKFLLLISAMLAMTSMMAQDVYSAGYYQNGIGKCAGVYRNGTKIQGMETSDPDYYFTSNAVLYYNGDVYWARNRMKTSDDSYYYGDIMKNSSMYLNSPTGQEYHVNAIFEGDGDIFGAGCMDVNSVKTAVVWKNGNTSPYLTLGNGTYKSEATAAIATYFAGGYWTFSTGKQYTSATAYKGVVWKADQEFKDLGTSVSPTGIAHYYGSIYVSANKYENGSWIGKVYKIYNGVVSEVMSRPNGRCNSICFDGEDWYVSGWEGTNLKVWRNGVELYSTPLVGTGNCHAVEANSYGVYYAGMNNSNHGVVYKDGEQLYDISLCERVYAVSVDRTCLNNNVRTLPYTENFTTGATDWECWTRVDVDESHDGQPSYWHRRSDTDNNYACHGYDASHDQEGWLISPPIYLQPGRDITKVTFNTKEGSSSDYRYEGLWVSTSNSVASFTTELWTQNNPTNGWKNVEVNLNAYQGQIIYLGFKYTGENGHIWHLDDIEVTESWGYCNAVTSYPYTDSFSQFLSSCYFIQDNDHSGALKNWKYNSSEHCVMHPYGQENTPQEGWLITNRFQLSDDMVYTLSFNTRSQYTGSDMKSSVWVAVDKTGTPNLSDYQKIWEESNYVNSWQTRDIDLSEYAGHTINIAFKYEGTYAHNWFLDDLVIDEGLPEYNINVVANNPSWGAVSGGGTYLQGDPCTITATPNEGYVFLKWTKDGNDVSTEQEYTFNVSGNATYTAVFGEPSVNYYTIYTESDPAEGGDTYGGGTFAEGEEVSISASPNMGWNFSGWNDGNMDNPRTVVVTGDATYTANFSQMDYIITTVADPEEGGTITGGGTYHYGDFATLTATPNENYQFVSWTDGVATPSRDIIVTESATYTAAFMMQGTTTYTITVLSSDMMLGEVTGGGVYPEGLDIIISAMPIAPAVFLNWNDGDPNPTRTITVTGNATYTAEFIMPTMYTITVESLNPDMGTVTGSGEYAEGTQIEIMATPYGGYHFNGWDDDNYQNPRTITVTGNATYRARFSEEQVQTYTLTVLCNTNEGTVIGGGQYPAGTNVMIAAIPNSGFRFKEWNDGDKTNPRTVTVNGDAMYFATFINDGIEENETPSIVIYPNPANEVVRLMGINDNTEVRIYNTIGELVQIATVSSEEEINVSNLNAGVYFVRFNGSTLRFVKE